MKNLLMLLCLSLILLSCRDHEDLFSVNPFNGGSLKFSDASSDYQQVLSYAKSIDKSVELITVSSQNVNMDGSSGRWIYQFVSNNLRVCYYFEKSFNEIKLDSTGNSPFEFIGINSNWVSSETALYNAEKNGGRAFLHEYPVDHISAALSQFSIPPPSSFPIWYITYYSRVKNLTIMINAATGEFISNSSGTSTGGSSVGQVVGDLLFSFSIPKTVFGINDTLNASMNALNIGTVSDTLIFHPGGLNWNLKNESGQIMMQSPRFNSSGLLGLKVIAPNQSVQVGLISAPLKDSMGNSLKPGSYTLSATNSYLSGNSLSLNLTIQ
jgi:hypothetical protein